MNWTTNLKEVPTIKKVTLDIGGTPVVYASNVMIDLLEKMYKKFQATGRVVFDFSKFEYRSPAGIYGTQLVTGLRDDVTLLVEFGEKGATDPVVPTMKAKAWVTDNDGAGRVFVPNRYELTQYSGAGGEHNWNFPNGAPSRHLQRVIFNESEVTISKIKVQARHPDHPHGLPLGSRLHAATSCRCRPAAGLLPAGLYLVRLRYPRRTAHR